MKWTILFALIFQTNILFSQSSQSVEKVKPFSHWTLESSFSATYYDSFLDTLSGKEFLYYQQIRYSAVMTNMGKKWYVGYEYSRLRDLYNKRTTGRYYFSGVLFRFDQRLLEEIINFQADLGVHRGNICICKYDTYSNNWPFKIDPKWYYSAGINFRINFSRSLSTLLGFNSYYLLNSPYPEHFAYVQILAALQWRLNL